MEETKYVIEEESSRTYVAGVNLSKINKSVTWVGADYSDSHGHERIYIYNALLFDTAEAANLVVELLEGPLKGCLETGSKHPYKGLNVLPVKVQKIAVFEAK